MSLLLQHTHKKRWTRSSITGLFNKTWPRYICSRRMAWIFALLSVNLMRIITHNPNPITAAWVLQVLKIRIFPSNVSALPWRGRVLQNILYWEAPPGGQPNLSPFIDHFWQKRQPFHIYIYTNNGVRFKLLSLQFCKILLITFPALIRTSLPEREKKHPFSSQEGKPRGTTIWRTPTVLKPAYSNFICLSESPPVW